MRRPFDEANRASACGETLSLFPLAGIHYVHRKSLSLRSLRVPATEADRKFSLGQPIRYLTPVPAVDDIHGSEKTPDKVAAKLGIIVKEDQRSPEASACRILGDNFSFPFWLEKVPVGLELFGVDQVGIVIGG